MAPRNDFADKFRQLLKDVPENYTLEQWQDAYRRAIFLMGMQILERFESEAIAQQAHHEKKHFGDTESAATPAVAGGGVVMQYIESHGGGPGSGGNPSIFLPCPCNVFPDYPLALQAAATLSGRARSK
jgi:hypothetical protein